MFKNLAQSFRGLTLSPMASALDQAHRMAQRRLEQGGAVMARGADKKPGGFVVPSDLDPVSIASAIEAKLRSKRNRSRPTASTSPVLERDDDGLLVVSPEIVSRLGDGDDERGRQFLNRAIGDIRGRRALVRAIRSPG
jgi:hypothetical protein